MLVTYAKHRQPVMSFAELMLPLPASREIWLAPDATSWRLSYAECQSNIDASEVSVRRMSAEEELSSLLFSGRDRGILVTMKLCAIAAQVWDYQQMRSLSSSGSVSADPSSELWAQARLQKL